MSHLRTLERSLESSSRILRQCYPTAESVEGRRHMPHLRVCRTEHLERQLGWQGKLAWLKMAEDKTGEGTPWVGMVAVRNEAGGS